jgi:hypothetical protein
VLRREVAGPSRCTLITNKMTFVYPPPEIKCPSLLTIITCCPYYSTVLPNFFFYASGG